MNKTTQELAEEFFDILHSMWIDMWESIVALIWPHFWKVVAFEIALFIVLVVVGEFAK